MKKVFCDCCKEELTEHNILKFTDNPEQTLPNKFLISVIAFIDFDLCKYCLFDEIYLLDDRQRAAEK